MSKQEFEREEHAGLYSKYRPKYPIELIERIVGFLKEKHVDGRLDLAVDVACGNGQATFLFAPYFDKVNGYDISENQIKEAIKSSNYSNVSFYVSSSAGLPLENATVDLITVAQAVHWFDLEKFYDDCKRILKPNGVLAIFGYDIPTVVYKDKSVDLINKFRETYQFLEPYFAPELKILESKYESVRPTFGEVDRNSVFTFEYKWKPHDLFQYAKTWSGYQNFIEKNPESVEWANFEKEFLQIINENNSENAELTIIFEVFLILARNN